MFVKTLKAFLIVIIPVIIAVLAVGIPTEKADAMPIFHVPFPRGQVWIGQTRMNHNPQHAVDLNRLNDAGDPVTASARGKVSQIKDRGHRSYGRFIVIDHGGGWQTLYAHLSGVKVTVGQKVSQGEVIGEVGSSGGSTGAHLHYEQRYSGKAQRIRWMGQEIFYWGSKQYRS